MPSSSLALRFLVLSIAGVLLLTAPVTGAVGQWTPFGPPTGEIQEMLADLTVPRLLYALTPSGVYRSADGGLTWGFAGSGLPHDITALALDPQRPGRLWAAGVSGVFRSEDRGAHWKRASGADFQPFPPPPGTIPGRVLLAVLPGNPAVLFYAGHGFLDLWRSADGGRTWSTVPEIDDVFFLKTDPAGRIYAVRLDWSLWRSADAGLTWREVSIFQESIHDFAASPGRQTVLYATGWHAVYRSRNRGASWQIVLPAPEEGSVGTLAVDPQRPETVYVVVYRSGSPRLWVSKDAGATWRRVSGGPPLGFWRLLVAPVGRAVYAVARLDLASSRDQGRTWTQSGVSARVPTLHSHLRFDPADPSRIFAVAGGRLFLGSDGGRTWRHLPVRVDDDLREATDLVFDPVRGFLYLASGEVLLSKDAGRTWAPLGPVAGGIERIAFPSRSNLVAAGWGIFRSADRGRTWTETLSGYLSETVSRVCDRVSADPADPQRLFARCTLLDFSGPDPWQYGTAMWRSQDGGRSWTELPGFRGVACDPSRAGTAYGWTRDQVLFRSQDGGSTWSQIGEPGDHDWTALLVDRQSPDVLYAATNGYPMRVERSRDGGLTWESIQAGFRGVTTWSDGLWAHPTIPHQIYLVVDGGAFYEARFPVE